ncbi:type II toxin-antitoxin system VapC family toxin [Nocardiopsis sp. CNT-189]|uniref:type II toxin-antitoxin system VapC family toxin n=1 Tax=Nocardiopsis oceanisediminis TaxID=2816862 RepID=UPI003B31B16F
MIIVDTNVVSELMRPAPEQAVLGWLRGQDEQELFTTAVTVAEIQYGLARLADGRRKSVLQSAAEEVFSAFGDHVLPFDRRAAAHYARIVAAREKNGRPISGFDARIAAIASVHQARVATRSLKDFEETGIALVDPWEEAG